MHTNLDAQWLADLAQRYVDAEISGEELPVIDNAIAARLRKIADNLQGLDERSGQDQYDLGFLAGRAHQHSRSNILAEDRSRADVRKEIERITQRPSTKRLNVSLEELGL